MKTCEFCGETVVEFFLTVEGRIMCDGCYKEAVNFLEVEPDQLHKI